MILQLYTYIVDIAIGKITSVMSQNVGHFLNYLHIFMNAGIKNNGNVRIQLHLLCCRKGGNPRRWISCLNAWYQLLLIRYYNLTRCQNYLPLRSSTFTVYHVRRRLERIGDRHDLVVKCVNLCRKVCKVRWFWKVRKSALKCVWKITWPIFCNFMVGWLRQ